MHNHLGVSSLIIGVGLLLPGLCPAGQAVAQPHSARTQTEDLFKRSGITKINPGNRAADFTLGEVNGHAISLRSHRGNLVFLNFWATWCGPYRQEMPSMARLYREFAGQGLSLLAVNEKERVDQVASFMREYGLTFPVLLDFDGRVSSLYRVGFTSDLYHR